MRPHSLALVAIAIVLMAAAAACGGGDEEERVPAATETSPAVATQLPDETPAAEGSLERYFQEFARVEGEFRARGEEVAAGTLDVATLMDDLQNDIASLNPPVEAEALHSELIGALGVYAQVLSDISDPDGEPSELVALEEAFLESAVRVEVACDRLEEVATDNGIEADLNCASAEGQELAPPPE